MTGSETPDVFCAVFEYPDFMATWTLNYSNSYDNGWSIQFQGDKGTMIIDEAGFRIWTEPWKNNREPVAEDGRRGTDRVPYSEFSGLREVAEGAKRAGRSRGQRRGRTPPG